MKSLKKPQRKPYLLSTLLSLFALMFLMATQTFAAQPVELYGFVSAKIADCLNPKNHNHAPDYYLFDETTGEQIQLQGFDEQLQSLHLNPRQKVRIKGVRSDNAADIAMRQKFGRATSSGLIGSGADIEIQEIELLPLSEEAAQAEPLVPEGGNTLTMLSTLLVFISTDTHGCMISETTVRNLLFNNSTNANLGMQAITKGRYGLQLGNGTGVSDDHTIDLHLNVNSADYSSRSIESLALSKLFYDKPAQGGLGLNRNNWNRILLFAPNGITDSGFTAYAYYPNYSYSTTGMVSMYSGSWGSQMNTYLHELGHNFGFEHSGKSGDEYGDRTCAMGGGKDGARNRVYNAVKLLQKDWMDVFPNAKMSISADATIDLYPISSDPNVVTQPIMVNFPNTGYYASYVRNQEPYGYLPNSGDRDRVFVHSCANPWNDVSLQVANLAVGGSYNGPGVIIFECYGPNNEYATVSFDMNDGNAKPVANVQSISLTQNTTKAITLSGSDADGNTLTYSIVTNPTKGMLSGTAPNLTYTPNNNYLGADSFVFKVHDGKISSFATVSIKVNAAPVANNQSVSAFFESPQPITLTATDANNDPLSYSIVSSPSKGSLSGTPPNLIYTPNNGISGSDSFTFKAYDGSLYSNTATVSISISNTPNSAPVVNSGTDQTVSIGVSNLWTPASLATALWLDASDAPSVILNGSTVSAWNDKSGNNRHASQSTATAQPTLTPAAVNGRDALTFDGNSDFLNVDLDFLAGVSHSAFIVTKTTGYSNIYGAANGNSGAGSLHVGFGSGTSYRMNYWGNDYGPAVSSNFKAGSSNILNYVWTSGTSKQIFANGTSEGTNASAGTIAAMAGGGRISNVTGLGFYGGTISEIIMITGSVTVENRQKIEGYLAHKWGTQANLPATHPYKAAAPGAASTVVNLNGSATDADGHPLTTTWSVVSKTPSTAANPTFTNAAQPVTTVTFTEAATYTLRLSANDGYVTVSDEVTITVVDNAPTYALTVTSGSGDGTYASGAQVTITADAPGSGYRFVNWSTDSSGSFDDVYSATTTFTMPDSAATVTANYVLNTAPVVNAGADQTMVFGAGVPWTPADLVVDAWWDASDDATATVSGGEYQSLTDKSGNGRTLTAPSVARQPTRATWQGRNAIQIVNTGASGDVLATAANVIQTSDNFTIISVMESTNIGRGADGSGGWSVSLSQSSCAAVLTSGGATQYTASGTVGKLQVASLTQGSQLAFASNGGAFTTASAPKTSLRTSTRFEELGTSNGGSAAGYIGEVLIFRRLLSDSDRQKIEGYLAHKWGLAGNLPAGHPYKNAAPISGGTIANLNGSATDANGDPLTTTWSVVSKDPVTAANPTFANAAQPVTTATFTEAGTYVLRLSANDGSATSTDDITITVSPPLPVKYATWAGGTFANAFTDTALTSNPDGDSMSNLMEFAFGTDPTLSSEGPLAIDGSSNGSPVLKKSGGTIEFYFVRRKDHGTSGSVSYTPQFSSNLSSFSNSAATPTWVADSASNPTVYEVVKVPFPNGTKFGRVEVVVVP